MCVCVCVCVCVCEWGRKRAGRVVEARRGRQAGRQAAGGWRERGRMKRRRSQEEREAGQLLCTHGTKSPAGSSAGLCQHLSPLDSKVEALAQHTPHNSCACSDPPPPPPPRALRAIHDSAISGIRCLSVTLSLWVLLSQGPRDCSCHSLSWLSPWELPHPQAPPSVLQSRGFYLPVLVQPPVTLAG